MTQTKVSPSSCEDRGRGHPQNLSVVVAEPRRDGAPKPKACRRIIQDDTNAAHARHGIGLRRNLANLALDLNGRKQLQADGKRQTDASRGPENPPRCRRQPL